MTPNSGPNGKKGNYPIRNLVVPIHLIIKNLIWIIETEQQMDTHISDRRADRQIQDVYQYKMRLIDTCAVLLSINGLNLDYSMSTSISMHHQIIGSLRETILPLTR